MVTLDALDLVLKSRYTRPFAIGLVTSIPVAYALLSAQATADAAGPTPFEFITKTAEVTPTLQKAIATATRTAIQAVQSTTPTLLPDVTTASSPDLLTPLCGGVITLAVLGGAAIFLARNSGNVEAVSRAAPSALDEIAAASSKYWNSLTENQKDNYHFHVWASNFGSRLDKSLIKVFIGKYGENPAGVSMKNFVDLATTNLAKSGVDLDGVWRGIKNLQADVALHDQRITTAEMAIAKAFNQIQQHEQKLETLDARSDSTTRREIDDAYNNDPRLR